MKKVLVLFLIASMLSIAIANVLATPTTTIGVEPELILDPTLAPGSTFVVEIWIRNVVNLAGFQFKLSYNTAVLTATQIEYGGIFASPSPVVKQIFDAQGYLHYAVLCGLTEPPFAGDGRAAKITFQVDSEGESVLDLYVTKLGTPMGKKIDHIAINGFFSSRWPAGTLPSDVYIGLNTGLVEYRHMKITKVGTTQTLTAQIENMGIVPASARVHYRVLLLGAPVPGGDLMSTVDILPAETLRLSVPLDVSPLDRPAQYTVEIWVEYYGFTGWTPGFHGDPLGAKTTLPLFFKLED